MIAHVSEATLQALLDDELPATEQPTVREHVAGCLACRQEVQALRDADALFSAAMRRIDAADLRRPMPLPPRAAHPWRAAVWRTLPRAAVLVLGFAGVAAAALPGSPVRRWVAALAEHDAPRASVSVASTRPEPSAVGGAAPAETEPVAGIGVLPAAGEVRVVVEAPAPGLRVSVRLADQDRVDVRGRAAATEARFRTAPGRVTVMGAGAGELEIVLPNGVQRASVTVGGKRYLTKDGDRVYLLVPTESTGAEIRFPEYR